MDEELHNMDKPDFNKMNTEDKILWMSGHYSVPETNSKEKVLENLLGKLNDNNSKSSFTLTTWYFIYAAAAIIIFLLGFWFLGSDKSVENFVAVKGQQIDYKLPDGSKVMLNADTKLSFKKSGFKKERNVQFEGEAFFNIEKGNTFTISTNLAEIRILGTSFNVYARENQFKVSCFTGKILVNVGKDSVIIEPNESAIFKKNKLYKINESNINSVAQWRIGEFNFENVSLNSVFDEIERQFNVNFVTPKLDKRKFTGSFSNKNLIDALDVICIPMGLTYEIGSNSKIFIKVKSD